jgi:hypothetical protein
MRQLHSVLVPAVCSTDSTVHTPRTKCLWYSRGGRNPLCPTPSCPKMRINLRASQMLGKSGTIEIHCQTPFLVLLWVFFFFFFLAALGFELRASCLSYSTSPFLWFFFFFQDRVSKTICRGWLRTTILLISTSWEARLTGVSHHLSGWI